MAAGWPRIYSGGAASVSSRYRKARRDEGSAGVRLARGLEDRAAACRMGCRNPLPQPAAGSQQHQIPDLALGSDLASLALVERRVPDDWEGRYALRPVLMEIFYESPRFDGTCYRAANWIKVGRTQGRGKLDVRNEHALPVKDIWLKPLHRDWRRILNE